MARKTAGTVCIVDADRELHAILSATFALEGYRVVSSSRSRDALNKLNLQKFVAIFIDPGGANDRMDEVFKITATPGAMNCKTPIIVMGGHPETKIPPESLPTIAAVIAKPFSIDEIVGTLRTIGA